MLEYFKNNTTPIGSQAKKDSPSLIERGIFVQIQNEEYCDKYQKVIEAASKEAKG